MSNTQGSARPSLPFLVVGVVGGIAPNAVPRFATLAEAMACIADSGPRDDYDTCFVIELTENDGAEVVHVHPCEGDGNGDVAFSRSVGDRVIVGDSDPMDRHEATSVEVIPGQAGYHGQLVEVEDDGGERQTVPIGVIEDVISRAGSRVLEFDAGGGHWVVTIEGNGASTVCTTSLRAADAPSEDGEDALYDASIDGIESLVLACACAGIDVASEAFVTAINTAVRCCGEQH